MASTVQCKGRPNEDQILSYKMFQGWLEPYVARSFTWCLLKCLSWCGWFELISRVWLVKMNRHLPQGIWVVGRRREGWVFSASPKEVKTKAGLSLSMTFVDFVECKPAIRSCLQGTISQPRVNPSTLVGSPGMNSRTKLRKSGSATGFRKWVCQSTSPAISMNREILKVTFRFLLFPFLNES